MPRERLTDNRIENWKPTKEAWLRDTDSHLAVRARPARGGISKVFIFVSTLDYKDVRITIGEATGKGLPESRRKAREWQELIDDGKDPREAIREQEAAEQAAKDAARAAEEAARLETERAATPALEAWSAYVAARRPMWGESSIKAHEKAVIEGGRAIRRGTKTTKDGRTQPGLLRDLLTLPLAEIGAPKVKTWLKGHVAKRPTQAALTFRLLRGFMNWCADRPEYADQVQSKACASKEVREVLPKRNAKKDALEREMLRSWFEEVRAIANPVHSAYLQALLLTGARPGEVAEMRWKDVDFRWNRLVIRDKVEGERTIPLTPYVAGLLLNVKRINDTPPPEYRILHGKRIKNDLDVWEPSPWVFASKTAASGRMQEPRHAHKRALAAAGLPADLTLHGLRRSFGSLSEWCEVPAGIVAQIQGHKPSATAEKHYRVRPLDLLRKWHTKIEFWILEQAGIEQPTEQEAAPALRVVA